MLGDPEGASRKALGVWAYPTALLVSADGLVVWQGGRPTDEQVAEQVRKHLPRPQDWRRVGEILGHPGKVNPDGSYKVVVLREDVVVKGELGFRVPAGAGLNSYAAFVGTLDNATTMGDTCLLAHEVAPVIDALRRGGIEIVALHNHMLGDEPRLFFMHFQGQGRAETLARTIRDAWNCVGRSAPEHPPAKEGQPPELDVEAMTRILGRKPSRTGDGVVKFGLPRSGLRVLLDNRRMLPGAGIGCWAAFYVCPCGRVMVKGDTCVTRKELQPAIDALRAAGIGISAIHNHLLGERTQVIFMHFEGEGDGLALARGVRAAWDTLVTK